MGGGDAVRQRVEVDRTLNERSEIVSTPVTGEKLTGLPTNERRDRLRGTRQALTDLDSKSVSACRVPRSLSLEKPLPQDHPAGLDPGLRRSWHSFP